MKAPPLSICVQGKPFMISLGEHKLFLRAIMGLYALCAVLGSEVLPGVNEFLELVPLPTLDAQVTVLACMVLDTAAVFAIEWVVRKVWHGRI